MGWDFRERNFPPNKIENCIKKNYKQTILYNNPERCIFFHFNYLYTPISIGMAINSQ